MKRRYTVRNNTRTLLYGRMLYAIGREPKSAQEVAEAVGITQRAATVILARMGALRLAHRATPQRSRWEPSRWLIGPGDGSIPCTTVLRPGKAGADLVQLAALIRRLRTPTRTRHVIRDVGIMPVTAYRQLNALHEARVIYIHDWQRAREQGGPMSCRWAFGLDMPDAPKPTPIPKVERNRAARHKKQQQRALLEHVNRLASNASIFTQAQAA